jgi:hypothetical protein
MQLPLACSSALTCVQSGFISVVRPWPVPVHPSKAEKSRTAIADFMMADVLASVWCDGRGCANPHGSFCICEAPNERHVPRAPTSWLSCAGFGINEEGQSRFPRLHLAHPRHSRRRRTDSERGSGFKSHSLRRAATMSRRKPSQPGLAADATVAVQFETPSNGMRYAVGAMQSQQ